MLLEDRIRFNGDCCSRNTFKQCFNSCTAPAGHENKWLSKATTHRRPLTQPEITTKQNICFTCTVNVHKQSKFSSFTLRRRRILGSSQKYFWCRRKKLIQQEKQRKRMTTAGRVADLCALSDDVSLLWAEVRQDVCRVPLAGVVNSWTSCIEKTNVSAESDSSSQTCTLEP